MYRHLTVWVFDLQIDLYLTVEIDERRLKKLCGQKMCHTFCRIVNDDPAGNAISRLISTILKWSKHKYFVLRPTYIFVVLTDSINDTYIIYTLPYQIYQMKESSYIRYCSTNRFSTTLLLWNRFTESSLLSLKMLYLIDSIFGPESQTLRLSLKPTVDQSVYW